jgi:hypothetical protein
MALTKGHTTSYFGWELNNRIDSLVTSLKIPNWEVEQIDVALSSDYVTRKHLAGFKKGEGQFVMNLSQMNATYDWAASVWRKKVIEHDAAALLADSNFKVTRRIDFMRCLIKGIEWPAFEAKNGKQELTMTCKFVAEEMKHSVGSGDLSGQLGLKAKAFQTQNFRFEYGPLDPRWITKVTPSKVEVKTQEEFYGTLRSPSIVYSSVNFTDIEVEIAQPGHAPLIDLAQQMLMDGKLDEGDYLDCVLVGLNQKADKELVTFTYKGCGLKKIDLPELKGHGDTLNHAKFNLTVEELDMKLG